MYRTEHYRVLRFSGVDAQAFLQSQLTNDVAALARGHWQWQGYCTAKGRLQATFALIRTTDDSFEAVVPASTVEALAKRLMMFRLRSKVVIDIALDRAIALNLADTAANAPELPLPLATAPDSATPAITLHLPDGRTIALMSLLAAATLPLADAAVEAQWQLANINALCPEVSAATHEMFVPQMIGWDTVAPGGGVSFSKGCYPGQEIVARAHYRGAVKRHLERIELPLPHGETAPEAGATITLADGRSADICNAVTIAGKVFALVVA